MKQDNTQAERMKMPLSAGQLLMKLYYKHPDIGERTTLRNDILNVIKQVQNANAERRQQPRGDLERMREALDNALQRLQAFLDTFDDIGGCETQADIEDWRESLASTEPSQEQTLGTQLNDIFQHKYAAHGFQDKTQERPVTVSAEDAAREICKVNHGMWELYGAFHKEWRLVPEKVAKAVQHAIDASKPVAPVRTIGTVAVHLTGAVSALEGYTSHESDGRLASHYVANVRKAVDQAIEHIAQLEQVQEAKPENVGVATVQQQYQSLCDDMKMIEDNGGTPPDWMYDQAGEYEKLLALPATKGAV